MCMMTQMMLKGVQLCVWRYEWVLGVSNNVDNYIDPNWSNFKSKIENDVFLYYRAMCNMVMKVLGLFCVTLIPIWVILQRIHRHVGCPTWLYITIWKSYPISFYKFWPTSHNPTIYKGSKQVFKHPNACFINHKLIYLHRISCHDH